MTQAIEEAKRLAAQAAVRDHFPNPAPPYVGIGSGTTIIYVVEAIRDLGVDLSNTHFIPTGFQSRQLIMKAGLKVQAYNNLRDVDSITIAFDGADEVDEDLNCIKGGGACLFQEKLVAMRAKQFVCVADHRKLKTRLLTQWPTIPIEVAPIAAEHVMDRLRMLGSPQPFLREGLISKAGPVKTDQDFYIVDAPFKQLLIAEDLAHGRKGNGEEGVWEVETLAKAIKAIHGVLEVGIFCGPTGPEASAAGVVGGQRPVACYFGMEDGTVTVRKAREKRRESVATYPPLMPTKSNVSRQDGEHSAVVPERLAKS